MLALPTRSATYHRALGSGEPSFKNERVTQTLRRERHAHGDPLRCEGSNASSTNKENNLAGRHEDA